MTSRNGTKGGGVLTLRYIRICPNAIVLANSQGKQLQSKVEKTEEGSNQKSGEKSVKRDHKRIERGTLSQISYSKNDSKLISSTEQPMDCNTVTVVIGRKKRNKKKKAKTDSL
ncbi:hypothetical protein ACB094_11G076900 [Castanea mollissima]